MSADDTGWTPHRTLPTRTSTPAELLWRLRRGTEHLRAELRDFRDLGVEVQLRISDDEFFSGQRFPTRALAVVAADAIREAYERAGWKRSD